MRTSGLRKNYDLHTGPLPLSSETYQLDADSAYAKLLDSSNLEAELQEFLERNPCFVPGAWTPGSPSGHSPLYMALIAQPELPGLRSKRPDFMWIATHSAAWYPMLVEIERSKKPIFKNGAIPTHEFTQARNQLAQWRVWFSEPGNVQKFISDYGVPDLFTKFRKMEPHFTLIYGRQREFVEDVELSRQRGALMTAPDEELVSFDRLHADRSLTSAITVQAIGNGRYRAKYVMPTMKLGPADAQRLQFVDGLEDAIRNDERITSERKEFLIERIPYWRKWSKEREWGIMTPSDRE